jgi:hypothetical protein
MLNNEFDIHSNFTRGELLNKINNLINSQLIRVLFDQNGKTYKLRKDYSEQSLKLKNDTELGEIYYRLQNIFIEHKEVTMFYNRVDADADFDYWCKHTWLSYDQITALSLGKDPRVVSLDKIQRLANTSFSQKYIDQHSLIKQATFYPLRGADKIKLTQFVDWTVDVGLEIPKKMTELINNIKIRKEKGKQQPNQLIDELRQEIVSLKQQLKNRIEENITNSDIWPDNGETSEMNADKALAIMGWMVSDKESKYRINKRPNVKEISSDVNVRAIEYFGEDKVQFKSFDKRLGKAIKLLSESTSETKK